MTASYHHIGIKTLIAVVVVINSINLKRILDQHLVTTPVAGVSQVISPADGENTVI